jgi:hypothetical protein
MAFGNLEDAIAINFRVFIHKNSTPMVTLQLRQLDVPPGQRLLIHDLDWPEFEAILDEEF